MPSSKARMARVQQAQVAINREAAANKRAAGLSHIVSGYATDQDALRLMGLVPPDTRTLTARICGDPLFERSALHQKMRGTNA